MKTEGNDRVTRFLALTSIVTSIFFIFAAIAVHVIDRRYDPIRDFMSDYVVGPGGGLFTVAIYATAFGTLALAVALWRVMLPPARPGVGIALMVLFAVGYALLGTFPTDILDPGELPTTTSGWLHIVGASIGWFSFVSGSLLITRDFHHHATLARVRRPAWLFSCLASAAIVIFLIVEMFSLPVVGLAEKSFIACRETWLLVVGFALLRSSG